MTPAEKNVIEKAKAWAAAEQGHWPKGSIDTDTRVPENRPSRAYLIRCEKDLIEAVKALRG